MPSWILTFMLGGFHGPLDFGAYHRYGPVPRRICLEWVVALAASEYHTISVGRRGCPVRIPDAASGPLVRISRRQRRRCRGRPCRPLRWCGIGIWNAGVAKPYPLPTRDAVHVKVSHTETIHEQAVRNRNFRTGRSNNVLVGYNDPVRRTRVADDSSTFPGGAVSYTDSV